MPNRNLSDAELSTLFRPLIGDVRARLEELSKGNPELLWALRRKLAKELTYDERGKPMHRRKLKEFKRGQQAGRCAVCGEILSGTYDVLDRLEAMKGYTEENTRLICQECDVKAQKARGYT